MSTNPPNTDDLQDRYLDQALQETLGGETPPDLSERILDQAQDQLTHPAKHAVASTKEQEKKHIIWSLPFIAVGLLIAVGMILPSFQASRESARRSPIDSDTQNELKQLTDTPTIASDISTVGDSSPISKEQSTDNLHFTATPKIISESAPQQSHPASNQPNYNRSGREARQNQANPADPENSSTSKFGRGMGGGLGGGEYRSDDSYLAYDSDQPLRQSNFGSNLPARPPISSPTDKEWGRYKSRHKKWADVELESKLQAAPRFGQFFDSSEQGQGPGKSGDQYTRIYENPFIQAQGEDAVSTFSIDVDTASYANVRQFLMQGNTLPPPDAVRIEELINYFDYRYSGPTGEVPFASHIEIAGCPWQPEHRLVRVGIKGREIDRKSRPQSNLVFLVDVSGSMNEPNKLPLLVEGMKLLTRELGENDRVAIVVYASSEGLALPSTRGDQQDTILAALEQLRAGGSTAGGAGIQLAYQVAQDHFIAGGVNRVILATDGDFNVGTTSTAELERMAETKAKETGVFLTVLGFGRGNLNDSMMEAISGKGNGNYHYVDNQTEARKVLVEEMVGTLVTIAKDVKIQIEFNPAQVAGYRLLGYENRMLRTEDFNDDKKDAGEIGAGHTVTALYEIVPAGKPVDAGSVEPLKYQQRKPPVADPTDSNELLTLKIRYKQPDADTSTKLEFPITDDGQSFAQATADFKFASAVASFGMLLRASEHRGNTSYAAVHEIAASVVNAPSSGLEPDPHGYRAEFLQLIKQAQSLAGE